MGSIYLVRHGQASLGAEDYDVLSSLGVQQSHILGDYLVDTGVIFNRCFSGDMRRQKDTARSVLSRYHAAECAVPELTIDSAFNEIDVGSIFRLLLPKIEGDEPNAVESLRNPLQNQAEFQRLFAMLIQRWAAEIDDIPEHLRWNTFIDTVETGLQGVINGAAPHEQIGIFTSGGTITAILYLLTGLPTHKAFELNWQIVNTSLSRLKFRDDSITLASFNGHPHLDLLKDKKLITYR